MDKAAEIRKRVRDYIRNGTDVTPEDKADALEYGSDLTLKSSTWTRMLVAGQYMDNGVFADAVDAIPAAGVNFGREVWGHLYGMDDALPEETPWAGKVLQAAKETAEWANLSGITEGDRWASSVGAAEVLSAVRQPLIDALKELETTSEEEQEEAEENDGQSEADKEEQRKKLQALLDGGLPIDGNKLGRAVKKAAKGIKDTQKAAFGLGAGYGHGPGMILGMPRDKALSWVHQHPRLRQVATLAGRYLASSRMGTDARGRETVTTVEFGNEFSLLTAQARTLPTMAFAKRYLDRSLPQWRLQGSAKERGPIVVMVDESGSMVGSGSGGVSRITVAKAVVLALLQTCIKEGRPFSLVRFDDDVIATLEAPNPARVTLQQLTPHIEEFSGGGTTIPFSEAKRQVAKLGHDADVVLITDAEGVEDEIATWEHKEARLHGILIEAELQDEDAKKVFSSLTHLNDVDLDKPEDKLATVLDL